MRTSALVATLLLLPLPPPLLAAEVPAHITAFDSAVKGGTDRFTQLYRRR